MGGPCFVGRSSSSYGFFPSRSFFSAGFSTTSTAEHYCQFHLPGTIPEAGFTVIFGGDHCHLPPGGFRHAPPPPAHNHHAPASVVAASALAALPLRPLSQEDLSASLAWDLTMSFLVPNNPPVAVPLAPPPPPPGVTTPAPAPSSSQLVLSPTAVPLWPPEPFKLPVIKDAKAYLDVHDMIQYYLHQPEYATQRSDDALVTTPSNVVASLF